MPQTRYVIADFAVVQGKLESTYAQDPGGTKQIIPIYNVETPVQHRQDFEVIRPYLASLGAVGGYPVEAFKAVSFTTYVYNSGDRTVVPPWADVLLPCSGFRKSTITGTAPTATGFTSTANDNNGGNLNGSYQWVYSLVDSDDSPPGSGDRDETPASSATTALTVTNGTATVNFPSGLPSGKIKRLYRTVAGGNTFYWVADVPETQNSYTDNTNDYNLDFTRTAPVTADQDKKVFTPTTVDHESAWIEFYMHSFLTVSAGSRGSWRLEATSGRAMAMNWDLQGVYIQPESSATPPLTSALGPGLPYRLVNMMVQIFPTKRSGTTSLTGYTQPGLHVGHNDSTSNIVLKRLAISPGTQVNPRLDALSTSGVRELGIHQAFQPTVEMTIEVSRGFNWNPIQDYSEMVDFGIKIVTQNTGGNGRNCEFSFPNCQISAAPALAREDGGILTWNITFTPKNIYKDDWMRIVLF